MKHQSLTVQVWPHHLVSASLPPLAAHARPHPRELTRPDTYGSSLRSKSEETTWSLIAPRTRFHPSGAPVAAGAVLLCQSHGCFYFPRWRSPCRPGLSRSQHTAHRGRTAFAASPAAGAHRALRDRCCRARVARSRADGDEVRCAAAALLPAHTAHRRPVVSQDARLFSWRALRYAAGTASGAAAYALSLIHI